MLPYPHKEHRTELLEGLATCGWAADNGCFTMPGEFDTAAYLDWLASLEPARPTCLFVTAPDKVGDAEETLRRSLAVMPRLRDAGWLVAFVFQDGATDTPWDEFDVGFVGGSTEFKLGLAARGLVEQAVLRGKRVHMGRVNSYKRLQYAYDIGCSSTDGTFLKFDPVGNIKRLETWFEKFYQAADGRRGQVVSGNQVRLVGTETVLDSIRADTERPGGEPSGMEILPC
jgi:hypothetical protein